jgi:DNA-binding HxlR family transcriptional regulator
MVTQRNSQPSAAARRSYGQYCTLARALDVVGERWTLLVIRELLNGPKRFTDLIDGLPGIGRNLLAARLRSLEAAGLVRRSELPPPAASKVYELTDDGRALGPALAELSKWGIERLGEPERGLAFRPIWVINSMTYMADPSASTGVHERYEFRVDADVFHLSVDDGVVEARTGPAERPNLVVTVGAETLEAIFLGEKSAEEAIAAGEVGFDGPAEAIGHLLAIAAGRQTDESAQAEEFRTPDPSSRTSSSPASSIGSRGLAN